MTKKFQVEVTSTITEQFLVEAKDKYEAAEIATRGDLKPEYVKTADEDIWVEEVSDDQID